MLDVFNEAFRGLFLTFAFRYISENHNIKTINVLSQEIEQQAIKTGLPQSLEEMLLLNDQKGAEAMLQAAKLGEKRRIQ